ncbi:MAG: hypothetical protein Kow0032_07130 [Methyloligellaceae bacterium]
MLAASGAVGTQRSRYGHVSNRRVAARVLVAVPMAHTAQNGVRSVFDEMDFRALAVEGNRQERSSAARSIFACVEPFSAKGVGDQIIGFVARRAAGAFGPFRAQVSRDTTAIRAASNRGGSVLPRFAARRRIPAQAFAVK